MADEPKPPEPKGLTAAEVEAKVRELVATKAGGDAEKLCRAMFKTIAELRGQLAASQANGIPKDHVAVPKADADLLAEYKAIGTPKDLKAASEEMPRLKGDIAQRDHESSLASVSLTTGYNMDVFKRLAPLGTAFVPTKVKDTKGKETDSFDVKDKDAAGKERTRSLAQWEEDPEVKPMLPALKPAGKMPAIAADGTPISASSGITERLARRERETQQRTEGPTMADLVPVNSYGSM